jgi:hypothetical protein
MKAFLSMHQKKKNFKEYLNCLDESFLLLSELTTDKETYFLKCFFEGEFDLNLPKNQLQTIDMEEFMNTKFNIDGDPSQLFYPIQFSDQQLISFALSTNLRMNLI